MVELVSEIQIVRALKEAGIEIKEDCSMKFQAQDLVQN